MGIANFKSQVLFVDDERDLLTCYQDEMDYYLPQVQVHLACNAEEALKTVRQQKIDVMFTDGKMPGLNGIDLSKLAKEIRPLMRVYMISGYSEEFSTEQMRLSGVEGSFRKPIDFDKLIDFLKVLLIHESTKAS